eukprot:gene846-391_t
MANGLTNGSVSVVKAVIGDLTNSATVAQGFSMRSASYCVGGIIGPAIGGLLASVVQPPAMLVPTPAPFETPTPLLGPADSAGLYQPFLARYPYFLPCLVIAIFNGTTAVATLIYLPETLGWADGHPPGHAPTPAADTLDADTDLEMSALSNLDGGPSDDDRGFFDRAGDSVPGLPEAQDADGSVCKPSGNQALPAGLGDPRGTDGVHDPTLGVPGNDPASAHHSGSEPIEDTATVALPNPCQPPHTLREGQPPPVFTRLTWSASVSPMSPRSGEVLVPICLSQDAGTAANSPSPCIPGAAGTELQHKRHRWWCCGSGRKYETLDDHSPGGNGAMEDVAPTGSAWQAMVSPKVVMASTVYCVHCAADIAMRESFTLWATNPVELHGLRLSAARMGAFWLALSFGLVSYQLFVYKKLAKIYLHHLVPVAPFPAVFAILVCIMQLNAFSNSTAYPSSIIWINNSADPRHRAKVQAVSTSLASLVCLLASF